MANKENIDIKEMYGDFTIETPESYIQKNEINLETGLTDKIISKNRSKYGRNITSKSKTKKWYNYFIESLLTPFNSILIRDCSYFILYRCLSC